MMRIGNTILDLESLTEDDLTEVIKEAKRLRIRKCNARSLREGLTATLNDAKDHDFAICNKYTGEVLIADDWVVYDNELKCLHEGEWFH